MKLRESSHKHAARATLGVTMMLWLTVLPGVHAVYHAGHEHDPAHSHGHACHHHAADTDARSIPQSVTCAAPADAHQHNCPICQFQQQTRQAHLPTSTTAALVPATHAALPRDATLVTQAAVNSGSPRAPPVA